METNEKKPRDSGLASSKWMIALCFLVYSSAYIARGNFAYARTTMIEEGVIDVGVAAVLSAVYFGCYAVGQLVNGAAADKHSPFVLVSIGLVSIAITNASMMLPLSPYVRIVVWGLNGLAQSMLWCPIFYIISNVLHSRVRYFAITIITLTTPLGKASCAWLSGVAIGFGRWQYIFLMASSVILLSGVLWISFCLARRKDFVVDRTPAVPAEDEKKGNGLFGLLFKSGVVFMLPAMLVYGLFLNGVTELVPSILHGSYGLSSSSAAFLDSFIPLLGSLGVLVANLLYFKVFKQNDMKSAFFVMTFSLLPMAVMLSLALGGKGGYLIGQYADSIIFVVTYGAVYILQLSFGHYCVSLVPMKFSKFALAATVSGVANAVGYGGSAIASYAMNYAVAGLELWQTVLIWIACLLAASVFLMLALIKWNKFVKE